MNDGNTDRFRGMKECFRNKRVKIILEFFFRGERLRRQRRGSGKQSLLPSQVLEKEVQCAIQDHMRKIPQRSGGRRQEQRKALDQSLYWFLPERPEGAE